MGGAGPLGDEPVRRPGCRRSRVHHGHRPWSGRLPVALDEKAVGAIEAKPSGTPLAGVEPQSAKYSKGLPKDLPALATPLPFLYEATGDETMFTDGFDPDPRSRPVFAFHRPETLARWLRQWRDDAHGGSLRARLQRLDGVPKDGLRRIQVEAIGKVEASMQANRPRALAQMATGSGKTFMAANLAYRLVQQADAERVLFLVDRANLGRQTLRGFQQFATPGDGRKFTDLYNVQWLTSNRIDPAADHHWRRDRVRRVHRCGISRSANPGVAVTAGCGHRTPRPARPRRRTSGDVPDGARA